MDAVAARMPHAHVMFCAAHTSLNSALCCSGSQYVGAQALAEALDAVAACMPMSSFFSSCHLCSPILHLKSALFLTGSQYVGAQALAEALDTVAARMPHAHVRPKFRPKTGEGFCALLLSPLHLHAHIHLPAPCPHPPQVQAR